MTAVELPAVPRVLIAEADPWSRDLLKQVLLNVRCDARLDLCADGQQAMTLLSEVPYDLAIVDWELPGVDGFRVRGRHGEEIEDGKKQDSRGESAGGWPWTPGLQTGVKKPQLRAAVAA